MLHYYARKFFSPICLSPYEDNDKEDSQSTIHVMSVSDELKNVPSVLLVQVYRWNSMDPVVQKKVNVNVLALSAVQIYTAQTEELLAGKCTRNECFINVQLLTPDGSLLGPSNQLFLTTFKSANLRRAIVEISDVTQDSRYHFTLQLSSDHIAAFVWLEAYGIRGRFSDNGFLMYSSPVNLTFFAWDDVTLESLKKSLTVRSLMDIYDII